MEIKVVELFAGVGGFRLGLERASNSFKTVYMNQWEPTDPDQNAFKCYEKNFGSSKNNVCKNIKDIIDDIPDHDLLVGGFPCQDYSIAKKNSKGILGEKGSLWWQINDIIKKKRPSCVFLENVDRIIVSPQKQIGRDFTMILRCFYEAGYIVEWRVINAAEYGQAQRRRRTFIVAYREDIAPPKLMSKPSYYLGSKVMHEFILKHSILAKAFPVAIRPGKKCGIIINDDYYKSIDEIFNKVRIEYKNSGLMIRGRIYSEELTPKYEKSIPLSEILLSQNIDDKYYLKEKDLPQWKYLKGPKSEYRTSFTGQKYYFQEGRVAFPDYLDRPSRTMLTSESSVSRSSHVVTDKITNRLRTLVPVECERLNGFPDGWTGMLNDKYRYFTMGNALVVPLVTRIGKSIECSLFSN